ncbi:MAG: tetratricopeptide repeat-containing serine/threonine-protein kinase [Acidobacteriota bacterium]|nr:tetratricopeptide repeat-containing serine/threonine-protein kinase [Acidobacteriota bacterium]
MSSERKPNSEDPSGKSSLLDAGKRQPDDTQISEAGTLLQAENKVANKVLDKKTDGQNNKFEAGKCFGHYQIIKRLGFGGMGEVYLATDKKLERPVAVKFLNEKFSRHESNLKRFIREAKAASALNHPNILVIHEIGETEDSNYIVSEFIEGTTLRETIEHSPLNLSQMLEISIQVANALCTAHTAHIVHRDIKPENIIVRPDGYVKILDFGLAKLVEQQNSFLDSEGATAKQSETARGLIMGTINYMSPEQAKGERVDERTDVFSLGVVIYEMLAGRTPFAGGSLPESFANLINAEPQPLALYAANAPEELQKIVAKTLRKNKTERYQTMKSLLGDLNNFKRRIDFAEELENSKLPNQTLETAKFSISNESHELLQNENSIAVLPFANLSAEAENEYFCDGLAEELLGALSKIGDLKVAARSSAFSFKGKNLEVGEIAKVLRVKKIVEGSVRRFGNRMRIAVQLVNADDGYQLWSERYDSEVEDIFAVQDEITLAVIDALKVKLLNTDKRALLERYTPDVKAYEYLLRGNYYFEKRNLTPTPAIEMAIEMFKKVIEIDPNYALAHARLAFAYVWKAVYNDAGNPVWIDLGRESLEKAERLDHDLPQIFEVRNQIAWSKYGNFDIPAGVEEIRLARQFNPRAGHCEMAILAFHAGMKDETIREFQLARELDPTSDFIQVASVDAYALLGLYDEAIEIGRPFGCDANGFTHALIKRNRVAEAEAALNDALAKAPNNPRRLGEKVLLLAFQGKFAKAEAMIPAIAKQITISQAYHHVTYDFACAYALNGKADESVKWLKETVDTGMPVYPLFATDSHLDKIRQNPKFIRFLEDSKVIWEDLKRSFDIS